MKRKAVKKSIGISRPGYRWSRGTGLIVLALSLISCREEEIRPPGTRPEPATINCSNDTMDIMQLDGEIPLDPAYTEEKQADSAADTNLYKLRGVISYHTNSGTED